MYQRRDGRRGWIAAYMLPSGRRVRRSAPTQAAAHQLLRELRGDAAGIGVAAPTSRTVAAWSAHWLDHVVPDQVRPATLRMYRWAMDLHMVPRLGTIPLAHLTADHVEQALGAMTAEGLAPGTVGLVRRVLCRCLGEALRRGYVMVNVATLVDAPRGTGPKTSDTLAVDEIRDVIAAASDDPAGALAVLALTTGMRSGELVGLDWGAVDLPAGTVTVTTAKTRAGVRSVALPAPALQSFRQHRLAAIDTAPDTPVFVAGNGAGPMTVRGALTVWHRILLCAGVDRRRLHSARHSAASSMLAAGAPLLVVSRALGHADVATTANTYVRTGAEAQREAAAAMDRALAGGR